MMVAIPVAATIPVAKVTRQRGRPIASDAGTARTIEVGGAVAAFGPVAIPEITRERGWPVATHPWPVAAATWTVASQITRQRRGTIDVAQARAIATATTGPVPTDVSGKRGRPIATATAGQARRRERGLRGRAEARPIPGQRVRAANARTIPTTQLPTTDLARTRWQRRTVAESATGTARVSATKRAATGVASGEAVEAGLRSGLCRRQTGPTAGSTGSLRPGIIPWQSPAARTHSAKPRARHAARKRGWRLRTCRGVGQRGPRGIRPLHRADAGPLKVRRLRPSHATHATHATALSDGSWPHVRGAVGLKLTAARARPCLRHLGPCLGHARPALRPCLRHLRPGCRHLRPRCGTSHRLRSATPTPTSTGTAHRRPSLGRARDEQGHDHHPRTASTQPHGQLPPRERPEPQSVKHRREPTMYETHRETVRLTARACPSQPLDRQALDRQALVRAACER